MTFRIARRHPENHPEQHVMFNNSRYAEEAQRRAPIIVHECAGEQERLMWVA